MHDADPISAKTSINNLSVKDMALLDLDDALDHMARLAAHDMNNVLFAISSIAQIMKQSQEGDDLSHLISMLDKATETSGNHVEHYQSILRQTTGKPVEMDFQEAIASALRFIPQSYRRYIQYEGLEELAMIHADPLLLTRTIRNVLLNALEAADQKPISVKLSHYQPSEESDLDLFPHLVFDQMNSQDRYVFSIENSGEVIEQETLDKIAEPFYTTKDPAHHRGIGLCAMNDLLKRYHFKALFTSRPAGGVITKLIF